MGPGPQGDAVRSVVGRSGDSRVRSDCPWGAVLSRAVISSVPRGPGELMNVQIPANRVGVLAAFAVFAPDRGRAAKCSSLLAAPSP